MKSRENKIEDIIKVIRDAAIAENVFGGLVTKAQFIKHSEGITEWDLRKAGGFLAIKNTYFPLTDKDLSVISENKRTRDYIRKLETSIGDRGLYEIELLKTVDSAIKGLKIEKRKPRNFDPIVGQNMVMELMLSDIHFGKKTETFDLWVLFNRLSNLSRIFCGEYLDKRKLGYNVNKVLLPLIGDIIESYTMHGHESALGCEFGNSVQIQTAIDYIFNLVISPIADLGVVVHIPAVTGNHDRTEQKKTFNNPGETNVTWIIYNVLKQYCLKSGYKNVTFDIPRDSYTTYDLFGKHTILYEHLDNVSSPTKNAIEGLIRKRSDQVGKMISMVRGGHWHEYVCFGRGRIIINDSVCGQDSFAKVKGYNSLPGQTINFYVDDDKIPNGFLYSYPVHLGR